MAMGFSSLGPRPTTNLLALLVLLPLLGPATASLVASVPINYWNSYPNPFFTGYNNFEYNICNLSPTALAYPRLNCPADFNHSLSLGISAQCKVPITIYPGQKLRVVLARRSAAMPGLDLTFDPFAITSYTYVSNGSQITIVCTLETITYGIGSSDLSYRYSCAVSNGYPIGVKKVSMLCANFNPTAWAFIGPGNSTCSIGPVFAGSNSYRFWFESPAAFIGMTVTRIHNF